MRWKYIIPRLVLVLCLWAFLQFALDPLLRRAAVSSAQAVTGAKADIGAVATGFFPPRITVRNVALADAATPGTNLVEFDSLHFGLAGGPLLRRRFVVTEGHLTGVRFGTHRSDDGQLEHVPEPPSEPSWLSEQLTSAGAACFDRLSEQLRSLLDPNQLETYQVGQTIYDKWDARFEDYVTRMQALRPEYERLRAQFDALRRADPLEQLQGGVALAQRAEQLRADALRLKQELTALGPDVRMDFRRLDEARLRDREKILHTVDLLRPDERRISEAVIGDAMYRRLQEALTWAETATQYRQQLREQARPERGSGTTFEFPLRESAPQFHLRKLLLSGELAFDGALTPFEAQLTDVSNDARLLKRPVVFRLRTTDETPLRLRIVHNVNHEIPVTSVLASYTDADGRRLTAGRADQTSVALHLAELAWNVALDFSGEYLDGRISVSAPVRSVTVTAPDLPDEFVAAAGDSLNTITSLDADLKIKGTLRKPQLRLKSAIGPELADSLQTAFLTQLRATRQRLAAKVDEFASRKVSELTTRFSADYDALLADNAELLRDVESVRTLVASLRSGRPDASALFRTATESRLLDDRSQQKVDGALDDLNRTLREAGLPDGLRRFGPR